MPSISLENFMFLSNLTYSRVSCHRLKSALSLSLGIISRAPQLTCIWATFKPVSSTHSSLGSRWSHLIFVTFGTPTHYLLVLEKLHQKLRKFLKKLAGQHFAISKRKSTAALKNTPPSMVAVVTKMSSTGGQSIVHMIIVYMSNFSCGK